MRRLWIAILVVVFAASAAAAEDVENYSWSFGNFVSPSRTLDPDLAKCPKTVKPFDWDLYRSTYIGAPLKYDNADELEKLFFNEIYKKKLAEAGNCYGMALLSMLINEKGGHLGFCAPVSQYSGGQDKSCPYDDDGTQKLTRTGPTNPKLRSAIGQLHGHQVNLAGILHLKEVLQLPHDAFHDGGYAYEEVVKDNPALVSILENFGLTTTGCFKTGEAHTMVAYKAVADPASGSKQRFIYVYDPNRSWADPAWQPWYEAGRNRIVIDDKGRWEYCWTPVPKPAAAPGSPPDYQCDKLWKGNPAGSGDLARKGAILITPLHVVADRGVAPTSLGAIETLILSGSGAGLVQATDGAGRRLFNPGTGAIETDPARGLFDLFPWVPSDGPSTGGFEDSELFFRTASGGGPLGLEILAGGEGYSLEFTAASGILRIDAVGGSGVDRVRIAPAAIGGPSVVLSNTAGVSSYAVGITRVFAAGQGGREFRLDAIRTSSPAPVEIRVVGDDSRLEVLSPLGPASFDLRLTEMGPGSETTAALAGARLDAGQLLRVAPRDWSALADGGIAVTEDAIDRVAVEAFQDLAYGPSRGPVGEVFEESRGIGFAEAGWTSFNDASGIYDQRSGPGGTSAGGDRLQFVYGGVEDDFELTAEIVSLAPAARGGRYGLMLRRSAAPSSRYAFLEPAGLSSRRMREGTAAAPDHQSLRAADFELPRFLRLLRRGGAIYGYVSADGADWRPVGASRWPGLAPGGPAMAGFASAAAARTGRLLGTRFRVHRFGPIEPPLPPAVSLDGTTAGRRVLVQPFDGPDGALPTGYRVRSETESFTPHLWGGRLRLTEAGEAQTSVSAVASEALEEIDGAAWRFDFDLFAESDETWEAGGSVLTFVLAGARGGRGSIGEAANRVSVVFEIGPDFAPDSAEGAAPRGSAEAEPIRSAGYRVGIAAQGSPDSALWQTEGLPDLLAPEGVHVRLLYNRGRVQLLLGERGAGEESLAPALEADLLPLSFAAGGQRAVFGFAAEGGRAAPTLEIDNAAVTRLDCDDIQEVAVIEGSPEAGLSVGEQLVLDGSGSHGGEGDDFEPVSHRWQVIAGPAAILGPDHGPTATVELLGEGRIEVGLTVDDGSCANPATAVASFAVEGGKTSTQQRR